VVQVILAKSWQLAKELKISPIKSGLFALI